MISLHGKHCSCSLANGVVRAEGSYYRYAGHKRVKATTPLTVPVSQVLRVGETKTYSRALLAVPMTFGLLALAIKAIPVLGIYLPIIPGVYYAGKLFWRLPYQVEAWSLCGVLCLLTIPHCISTGVYGGQVQPLTTARRKVSRRAVRCYRFYKTSDRFYKTLHIFAKTSHS